MKNIVIAVIVVLVVGIGGYFLYQKMSGPVVVPPVVEKTTPTPAPKIEEVVATPPVSEVVDTTKTVIGSSVEERDITAYHYGTGDTELLFVGGIHGGYEWNTVLVAYELMDYLDKNPTVIPANVKVTVIPVLNPDGLNKVAGTPGRFTKADVPAVLAQTVPGRFNANTVDINRNFDCDWQATGKWQNTNVSGGSKVFSEPESQAIRDYVTTHKVVAAVVWYSAAGGVFASSCHNDVSEETSTLTTLFAKASGYPAYQSFDFYAITGDMVNWFAKKEIPAISVLLTTHEDTEWSKNKAGVEALLKHYAE